jgi:hypothetical protein
VNPQDIEKEMNVSKQKQISQSMPYDKAEI